MSFYEFLVQGTDETNGHIAYGDTNLFCTCPPVEDTTGAETIERTPGA